MASQEFPRIEAAAAAAVAGLVHGATFDDFLLTPQRSIVARRDPVGDRSVVPRVAAPHAQAADRLRQHGHRHARADGDRAGRGGRHRDHRPRLPAGDIQPQVREVEIVKRTQHGVISDPYSVSPSATVDQAAALMARSRVGTLVVLDDASPEGAADRA